jgi:hypothetical protein
MEGIRTATMEITPLVEGLKLFQNNTLCILLYCQYSPLSSLTAVSALWNSWPSRTHYRSESRKFRINSSNTAFQFSRCCSNASTQSFTFVSHSQILTVTLKFRTDMLYPSTYLHYVGPWIIVTKWILQKRARGGCLNARLNLQPGADSCKYANER